MTLNIVIIKLFRLILQYYFFPHFLQPTIFSFYVILAIPTFEVMPEDTTVPIGESVRLRCEPSDESGRSKTEVKWHMNGEPIERYLDGDRKRLSGNVS